MRTSLSVSTLLVYFALGASAKYRDPQAPVMQRYSLDPGARVVPCIAVIDHLPGTSLQYTITLEEECCEWWIHSCNLNHVDTALSLVGDTVSYWNDDNNCQSTCVYGPAGIGTLWGAGCLPAGTYLLDLYLHWGLDANCDFNYDPQGYNLCLYFCDEQTADTSDQPVAFELGDAFPNPFNPSTTISFSLAETAETSLKVYNMAGAEVASLVSGLTAAGQHSVTFDAASLASGVYFYTLEVAGLTQTRKMVLVK